MAGELTAATENNTRQDGEITTLQQDLQQLAEKVSGDETETDTNIQEIKQDIEELNTSLEQTNSNVELNTQHIATNTK